MQLRDAFPGGVVEACETFRRQAAAAGWHVESHPVAGRGLAGEPLTIDAAIWPGSTTPDRTLVLTGGVHGVEAPLGLAAATLFLQRTPQPPGRVVLIPVVNPWGFTHGRRMTENNIDLNRNFVLPGHTYAGSPPLYAQIDADLNPPTPPPRYELFAVTALRSVLRHGFRALKTAITGGQYDFPRGLFYGGRGPADSHRVLAEHWPHWVTGTEVVHLDFHTGLGRWGTYKLLLDVPVLPETFRRATTLGPVEHADPAGISYTAAGTFGPWAAAQTPTANYLYACAEFGTYPGWRVLAGLRRENRTHHYAPGSPLDHRAKHHLRELFCPRAAPWRQQVTATLDGLLMRVQSHVA